MITWTKDGQPLDTKKVNIRNSDKDSILFIRKSERDDSGSYEMTVKVDSFEDKATLVIQIVGETCYDLEIVHFSALLGPCLFQSPLHFHS